MDKLLELWSQAPCLFFIAISVVIIRILWKENKMKDHNTHDLAESVIKVAAVYEDRVTDAKELDRISNEQHSMIIDLLKDLQRIVNTGGNK